LGPAESLAVLLSVADPIAAAGVERLRDADKTHVSVFKRLDVV
jgi:hypothetical protein